MIKFELLVCLALLLSLDARILLQVNGGWPSCRSTTLQVLGLFPNASNASGDMELAVESRAMFKAAILLSQRYNLTINGQHIGWRDIPTSGQVIDALSGTCDAMSDSPVVGIIGPALSRESSIIANFADRIGIPVISYSATASELSDRKRYPNFYRTVPSDRSAAIAIVHLFLHFNWTSCMIIYQNDAYGSNGVDVIKAEFLKKNLIVVNTMLFDIGSQTIRGNLKHDLLFHATRLVLLWAEPHYASLIIQRALEADVLGPHFTWILSSTVSLDSFNSIHFPQLTGLFTLEPTTSLLNVTLLHEAYALWKQYEPDTFPKSGQVNDYALFAFDATWFLIQSLERFCNVSSNLTRFCFTFRNGSSCFTHQLLNSRLYLDTIHQLSVLGVSGHVQFSANTTDRINGSYYLMKNSQMLSKQIRFVPVLFYADHDGWQTPAEANSIIWPGATLIPPTGHPQLNGVSLRIGIGGIDPFTFVDTTQDPNGQNITKITGYVPDLVSLLQKKIGFIPDLQLIPSDVLYADLIESVANGTYDILIGDITVTANRRKLVDFSISIFDTSTYVIMRDARDVQIDLLSFLKPFSWDLWLLILGVLLFAGTIFCIFERQANDHFCHRSIAACMALSMWYCFGTLVGYGVEFHPCTVAGRALTVGLYILSIVLVASYTANLASELVIVKSKNLITGIDDIKLGKMPLHRIGIMPATSIEEYFLREVSRGIRNYHPLATPEELLGGLLKGTIDACLLDSGFSEYLINNKFCGLTLVGPSFDAGIFGVVTPKDWLYAQELDVNILSLRELGEIDRLRLKWFHTKSCPATADTTTAFGIASMSGLFLTFGIIIISSLLLFAWKKYSKLRKRLPHVF